MKLFKNNPAKYNSEKHLEAPAMMGTSFFSRTQKKEAKKTTAQLTVLLQIKPC